jgi:hypothetical protein
MALGILRKSRTAVIEPDPAGSRAKIARLTPKGREAQDAYRHLTGVIEQRWKARFGKDTIHALSEVAGAIGRRARRGTLPDGWRASVRKPNTLPHYPMVLHRGGFPDGS